MFAKGAKSPAVQIGFTSISFVKPAAANFAFSPPAGATVQQQSLGGGTKHTGDGSLGSLGSAYTVGKRLAGRGRPALFGAVVRDRAQGPGGLGQRPERRYRPDHRRAAQVRHPGLRIVGQRPPAETSLLSMLITNNGRVLVGAVSPQVLYQAAAQPAPAHTSQPGTK